MPQRISPKRIAIDKAYATMVAAVAAAAFVAVFSLVACKTLLDQRAYQQKVIDIKEKALETLENNIAAADQLTVSYQEFIGASTNVLGGNPFGDADMDGDNARIVLDALPSKYDFPALTTSIDKLLRDEGFPPKSINGTDEETVYSGNSSGGDPGADPAASATSTGSQAGAVEIPFSVEVVSNTKKGKDIMKLFERSIRPINIQTLSIKGNDRRLELSINAITYFQPERGVNVKTEAVR